MPRARAAREAELLASPDPNGTPWQSVVYARPGATFYLAPKTPRSGAYVQAEVTGGNFQMNAVDAADVVVRAQEVPRKALREGKRTVALPGSTTIASQRRNVDPPLGRTFWVALADLEILQPPSAWIGVGIGAGALGLAAALSSLAGK